LVYDTTLELRVNTAYILNDALNRAVSRGIEDLPYLPILFEGAIQFAIKKVRANFRAAVPQYYQDKIHHLQWIAIPKLISFYHGDYIKNKGVV